MKIGDIIRREVDRLLDSRWCAATVWGAYSLAVGVMAAVLIIRFW